MQIQELPSSSALGFGSDIWILPEPQSSGWSRRMDWLLNGQISKAEARVPFELPVGLKQILKEEELHFPELPLPGSSLLISGDRLVPAQYVLLLQNASLKTWLKKGLDIAKDLETKKVRFFLADSEDLQEAASALKSLSLPADLDLTLVRPTSFERERGH